MSLNKHQLGWIIYRFSWFEKKKKERISPNNKKVDKCFVYAVTVALNHEKIEKNPEKNNEN